MRDFKISRKELWSALFFVTVLCLLFAGLSMGTQQLLLRHPDWVQDRNKSAYAITQEAENSIDVIVLGDSLSYSSISPMELWKAYGMTVYVCGQGGQRIQESYHMLKTALQSQKPKLVILETNTMFRARSGVDGIKTCMEEWFYYHVPLLRNHDMWKSVFTNKRYPVHNYKGFFIRTNVEPYEDGKYMFHTKKKAELSGSVSFYMDEIRKLCKEHGAELMLFSAPSPVNYNYEKYNALRKYAKANGLNYLDMNRKWKRIGINWNTDSRDKGDHLNLSGAKKATCYLGDFLKETFELPDHRKEAAYQSWEKELSSYEKELSERMFS